MTDFSKIKSFTPDVIRKLNIKYEMQIIQKEIDFLNEWTDITKEIANTAKRGGATTAGLLEAFNQLISRMTARQKMLFKEKIELNKKW